MAVTDDRTKTNPSTHTYHTDEQQDDRHKIYAGLGERSTLLGTSWRRRSKTRFFQHMSPGWIPGNLEDEAPGTARSSAHDQNDWIGSERHRSFRRRFFLFLTEPDSSFGSALFFFVLIFAIFLSNVIMIMQTMAIFQYVPDDCHICGGDTVYMFDDITSTSHTGRQACVCPPQPFQYLQHSLDYLLLFFAAEWTLRVLCYSSADPNLDFVGQFRQWFGYLASSSTVIDALAIWPYFFEILPKGLVSLRLLRLFRVFQLVRLGQYNMMVLSLTNVLRKSVEYLKLMVLLVLFGAAVFGSMLFWLEQGTWKYWEPTGDYQYIRMSRDGVNEEISPFKSIPAGFWWFVVTATTVGYGDYYPTSTVGQWVAVFAMLSGVLVIAFPVSVFSDLWSEELKEIKGFESLFQDDADDNEIRGSGGGRHDMMTRFQQNVETSRIGNSLVLSDSAERFLSNDPMYVVMQKEDLNEIVSSLHSIRQNQRQIQNILRKYYDSD